MRWKYSPRDSANHEAGGPLRGRPKAKGYERPRFGRPTGDGWYAVGMKRVISACNPFLVTVLVQRRSTTSRSYRRRVVEQRQYVRLPPSRP